MDPAPAHRTEVHPWAFVKRFLHDLFRMRGSLLLMAVFLPIAIITVVIAQIQRFWAVGTSYINCSHLVSGDNDEVMDLLLSKSGCELSRKVRDPKDPLTSVQLVKACIRQINKTNVFLNAVVATRFRAALEEAAAADEAVRAGKVPLDAASSAEVEDLRHSSGVAFWGVPFVIKECMELPGMPYTAGIAGRVGTLGARSAVAIENVIRSSGAIVLATTNVSEGCMWHESVNNVYGRTFNPYDFGRAAGGSSGGCGAAVASCMTPMAITSDVGGSTRIPSVYNGVFGHKPTGGAVSNSNTIPSVGRGGVDRYCQLGPMSKHAEDLWPLLNALITQSQGSEVGNEKVKKNAKGEEEDVETTVSLTSGDSVVSEAAGAGPTKHSPETQGYDDADRPLPVAVAVPSSSASTTGEQGSSLLSSTLPDANAAVSASATAASDTPNSSSRNSVVLRAGDLTAVSSVDVSSLRVHYTKCSLGDPLLLSALHPEVPLAIGRVVDYLRSTGAAVIPPHGTGHAADDLSAASRAATSSPASNPETQAAINGVMDEVPEMFTLLNAFSMWSALMSREKPEPFYRTIRDGVPHFTGVPAMVWEFILCVFGMSKHHTLPALLLSLAECVVTLIPSENERHCRMATIVKNKLHALLKPNTVLILPSLPTPAPMHDESILRIFDTSNTSFFNVMELPVTAVPMGLNADGLPIGIQVVAGPGQDHVSIAVAMALQRAGLAKWEAPRPVQY